MIYVSEKLVLPMTTVASLMALNSIAGLKNKGREDGTISPA